MSVDHQHNLDHTDDKFINIFSVLSSGSNGRLGSLKFTVFVVPGSNSVENTPFLKKNSYWGNFAFHSVWVQQ